MLAILGAAIVYWVLMSNFLFSTVVFVHGELNQHHLHARIVESSSFQTGSPEATMATILRTTASSARATRPWASLTSTTTHFCPQGGGEVKMMKII